MHTNTLSGTGAGRWGIVVLLAALAPGFVPQRACAWKPTMHAYLSNLALQDARDQNVTIYRLVNGHYDPNSILGNYAVDTGIYNAIKDRKSRFASGSWGPDNYPDILVGQQYMHPDTDAWLAHVWSRRSGYNNAAKSFVQGILAHAAGDCFGHTFINNYAGKPFEFIPEPTPAIRHMVVEGYVDHRSPRLNAWAGREFAKIDFSIYRARTFIYNELINAKRGSGLRSLLQKRDVPTVPLTFCLLRDGLQGDIDAYYTDLAWYDNKISKYDKLAKDCGFWDPCSAAYYRARAYAYEAEKAAYRATYGNYITYLEYWAEDIDDGLWAWMELSHELAWDLYKGDLTAAQNRGTGFMNDHLLGMSGAPDAVGGTLSLIGDVGDFISELLPSPFADLLAELKEGVIGYVLEEATGMTVDEWREIAEDAKSDAGLIGLGIDPAAFRSKELGMGPGDTTHEYTKVPPAFNTVTLIKLSFLSKAVLNSVIADAGGTRLLSQDNIMLGGWMKSMDHSCQWKAHTQRMVLAYPENATAWQQLFMEQTGEDDMEAKFVRTGIVN